jgi:hypothetical protein
MNDLLDQAICFPEIDSRIPTGLYFSITIAAKHKPAIRNSVHEDFSKIACNVMLQIVLCSVYISLDMLILSPRSYGNATGHNPFKRPAFAYIF